MADRKLALVLASAPLVLGGAGSTPSVPVQFSNVCMVAQVGFSGVVNATTFTVEISRDGGTEWVPVALSPAFKAAAAAGGEVGRITALQALGLDYRLNMSTVPGMAAGSVAICFDTYAKSAASILVRVSASAACTITHAEIVPYKA